MCGCQILLHSIEAQLACLYFVRPITDWGGTVSPPCSNHTKGYNHHWTPLSRALWMLLLDGYDTSLQHQLRMLCLMGLLLLISSVSDCDCSCSKSDWMCVTGSHHRWLLHSAPFISLLMCALHSHIIQQCCGCYVC